MVIDMNTARLETIGQVREFLAGICDVELHVVQDEAERRRFVERTLRWFGYFGRPRGERGLLFAYVQRVSGYSRAHVIRLIAQYRESGTLAQRERGTRTQFPRRYTDEDVALLVELDSLHDTLSGAATRALARRACQVYGDARYERLSHISVSHLYNLRASQAYRQRRLTWTKTRPSPVQIAVRKAPAPEAPARLYPYRYGPSRRSGRRQGRLSRQRGGHRHAMGGRGRCRAHQRGVSAAGHRADAREFSVRGARLSL